MRISALVLAAVLSAALPVTAAHACGESLFRVGRGVAYRAQTAPLPGNVLMVAPTAEAQDLAVRLAAAGHHVHTVTTSDEIAAALNDERYDVILAPFADRATVEGQAASAATAARFVPITLSEAEKTAASESYPRRFVAVEESFTQFLRVIHHTLKKAA